MKLKDKHYLWGLGIAIAVVIIIASFGGNAKSPKEQTAPPAKKPDDSVFAEAKYLVAKEAFDAARGRLKSIDSSSVYFDSAQIYMDTIMAIERRVFFERRLIDAESRLEEVESFNGESFFGEVANFREGVNRLAGLVSYGNECSTYDQAQVASICKKIEAKAKAQQQKWLPIFRKEAAKKLDSNLWTENIDVRSFGAGHKTIEFIGVFFASNANIAEFDRGMRPSLSGLGFTRVQYKWYEGASEYQYYKID